MITNLEDVSVLLVLQLNLPLNLDGLGAARVANDKDGFHVGILLKFDTVQGTRKWLTV